MHTYFQYCYHAYDYTTTLPHGRMFEMGAKISFNRTQYKLLAAPPGWFVKKLTSVRRCVGLKLCSQHVN